MPRNHKSRAASRSALIAVLVSSASLALAQSGWPAKPVKLLVPVAPGGAVEAINRLLADRLAGKLKDFAPIRHPVMRLR